MFVLNNPPCFPSPACGRNYERRAGRSGRFKILVQRVNQLEKRIAAIEQCKRKNRLE